MKCLKKDGSVDETSRYIDPGHPGVVEHNLNVIMDCLENYDIDGVHFDYIRYAGRDYGYNPVSVERFNTIYGRSGIPDATDEEWCNWRRECVTLEVKRIYINIWKEKPEVLLTTATFFRWRL